MKQSVNMGKEDVVSKMSNKDILEWAKKRAIEMQKRECERNGRIARM